MKRSAISQREARALKRRVQELEAMEDRRRNAWAESYPGGANIATSNVSDYTRSAIKTARLLKHAVVVTVTSDGNLAFYALPLGSRA
jgi:hypothetical protein